MNLKNKMYSEEGNILIMSVVIMSLLIATGMGYMKWAADEGGDSAFEAATVQAYFLGQIGVVEQGLKYLRGRTPSDLPQGTVLLPSRPDVGGKIPGTDRSFGAYRDTKIMQVVSLGDGSVFQRSDTYDVLSTGEVTFTSHLSPKKKISVRRTATMRARLRSFANYMYLTHHEVTRFGEIIWFWREDTLYGRTHSNDKIGMKFTPQFYGPISTSKDAFEYYEADPYFAFEPLFGVPEVYFPTEATGIRNAASPMVSSQDGRWMTRIFLGPGIAEIYQYPMGGSDEDIEHRESVSPLIWNAIFVLGEVEILSTGDGFAGNLTIGSAGDMWLIDNIKYGNTDRVGRWPDGDDGGNPGGMLGLVSEKNIIIRDNWANGKQNSQQGRHIIINAGMVALGESFTFQHQNDDWELYQGPEPDERGTIYLKGAVTQWRRGYVHRSNHGGTGYGKGYKYDFRFDTRPPPFYLEAMDENGHGLFDIISWGELDAAPNSSGRAN